MANKIDISKLVTVNTVIISNQHINGADDGEVLSKNQYYEFENGSHGLYWINGTAGGWIIRVHACPCFVDELKRIGLAETTIENIKAMAALGFDAIQFDCDGDEVDGLHGMDW